MKIRFHGVVFLILLISVCSCMHSKKKFISNKRLLNFKDKGIVYNQDELIEIDTNTRNAIISDTFNKTTDTITYRKGIIYISCLKATTASSEIKGSIEFVKDTIKLMVVSDLVATEENVDRMIYEIENKSNKHYFLKKY